MKDIAPNGWEIAGIEELEQAGIVQLGRGKVISKIDLANNPGSYPVYSSAKENDGKFGEYGEYMFEEELITWSVDGGGKLFHRPRHRFSITNVGGFIRVLQPQRIDCRYLYFALSFLHSQVVFDWVRKAHPSVIRKVYDRIPLPPLEEQQQIVVVLDEAFEGLARARAHAEANLRDARELFSEVVTRCFLKAGVGATETTLGNLAEFRNGLNYTRTSKGKSVKIVGVGDFKDHFTVPVETLSEIVIDGDLATEDRLRPGDLLAVRSNGNRELIGRTMLVPDATDSLSFSGFTIRIRLSSDKLLPEYLCEFMRTKAARRMLINGGGGSNISNLNQKLLFSLPIAFPNIADQRFILEELDGIRAKAGDLVGIHETKIRQVEALRQSLLQKAFAGELT